jgi:hypothetical protein
VTLWHFEFPVSIDAPLQRTPGAHIVLWLIAAMLLPVVLIGCGGGGTAIVQTPPPPAGGSDALGTVKADPTVDCALVGGDGGVAGGTCYKLTISCPSVADEDVALKLNSPVGNPVGAILFTIGGGGSEWYDRHFAFGAQTINDVVGAGFRAVQLDFEFEPAGFPPGGVSAGWLTGPGGPRKTACRWATAAMWIHDNLLANNAAFCATGNSAGSAAAAYALAHYGLDSIFDMLEETSGPPLSRLDHGCICDSPPVFNPCVENPTGPPGASISECYGDNGNKFIDPSYDPLGHICSSAEQTHDATNQQMFINDSILAPDAKLSYPHTDIHFVFGGQDTGSADPQALEWKAVITGKTPIGLDCVPDAPHQIADVQDGAKKISSDLIQFCHR